MARTYLVFGDIDGKLDVLCVECTKIPPQGPPSRPAADREVRPQGQYDEMERIAQRRLSKSRRPPARSLRLDMS
jgi:hypothetical protein